MQWFASEVPLPKDRAVLIPRYKDDDVDKRFGRYLWDQPPETFNWRDFYHAFRHSVVAESDFPLGTEPDSCTVMASPMPDPFFAAWRWH